MAILIKVVSILRSSVEEKRVVDRLFELSDCRLAKVDALELFLDRKSLILQPYAFADHRDAEIGIEISKREKCI